MYDFVKTTEEAPVDLLTHTKTIYNGVSFDDTLTDRHGGFRTLRIIGRGAAKYTVNTAESSTTVGGMYGGRSLNVRTITVLYRIWDKTSEGFRRRFERLNVLLQPEEAELRFTDDPHTWTSTFSEGDDPEEESNDQTGTLTFICHDPYKYRRAIDLLDIKTASFKSMLPVHPVFQLHLDSDQTEVRLTNETRGLELHLKSETPFSATEPIVVDTERWSISQGGTGRLGDLVITSDLEDFVLAPGDELALSVPGRIDATVRGVSL